MKILMAIVCLFFPSAIKRWLLNRLGHSIAKTARIGFSIVATDRLVLSDGASIGHLNIIKKLRTLELGQNSSIGHMNWVSAFPWTNTDHFTHVNDRGALIIGDESAITTGHYLDCTASITVGNFTTIAGRGTHFLTHGIDIELLRQDAAPIRVGDYCLVGTRSLLLAGASLNNRCVLAAGSTLTRRPTVENQLYAGVPAVPKKTLKPTTAYFTRVRGYVD